MKAYHLNGQAGAGRLVRADVSRPTPASGEVRIRVEAASLNYRDLLILDAAGAGGLDGRVPLCDGAGIVDAIGADVSRWRVGDRVAAGPAGTADDREGRPWKRPAFFHSGC